MERAKDVSTLRKIDQLGMTRDELSEKIEAALRDSKSNLSHDDIQALKVRKLRVKEEIERLRREGRASSTH